MDNKTVLDPEDDVAYIRSGGGLRIPTDAEWTELKENCDWTWNEQLKGYFVDGRGAYSSQYIFIPANGLYGGSGIGTAGGYWSSSVNTVNTSGYRINFLFFSQAGVYITTYYPFEGNSIWPVAD